ncbi:hypothetical protein B0H11DRAFT_2234325 [Mycena galericulata]|nr:hypothetical protein B0H11DRAFT_2234325 [Mycena galericulata]
MSSDPDERRTADLDAVDKETLTAEIMGFLAIGIVVVLLAASWVNMALYTFELVLCVQYFRRPSRPWAYRTGVGLLVLFDTVCTLGVCFDIGLAIAGSSVKNSRLLLAPLATQIMATYASSLISQLFLTNVLYTLTGSKIVGGALLILSFVHLGFSWACAVTLIQTEHEQGIPFTLSIIAAVLCAATDISIAVSLTWKFWMMMGRTFSTKNSTQNLVRQVMILTISSGSLCAGNTLIMMVLLLKHSDFVNLFFVCQGRVYALTLLGNFLVGIPGRNRELSRTTFDASRTSSNHVVMFREPDSLVTGLEGDKSTSPSSKPKALDRLDVSAIGSAANTWRSAPHLHLDPPEELPHEEVVFRSSKADSASAPDPSQT